MPHTTQHATRPQHTPPARRSLAACAAMLLSMTTPLGAQTTAPMTVPMTAPTTQPAASPGALPDPFVHAVANIRPSVVGVGSYYFKDTPTVQYSGTGFVVGDGLTIVTNQHVVEAVRQRDRMMQLRVYFPDGKTIDGRRATVVAEDRFHDVALLRMEGAPAAAVTLNLDEPAQGQSIGILGYPIGLRLGLVPAAHRGVVAAVVPAVLPLPTGVKLTPELAEAFKNPYNLYQLDMVVYPGNSGSPLFDAHDGRVIGIINKTLATKTREHLLTDPSGISYAVPIRWVHELLVRLATTQPQTLPDQP